MMYTGMSIGWPMKYRFKGKRAKKGVMVDLMNVKDKLGRAKEVIGFGADYVLVHCGLDEQKLGKTPLNELRRIKENSNIKVAVAGGINLDSLGEYIKAKPDIIVVGSALVKNPNRRKIGQSIHALIKSTT